MLDKLTKMLTISENLPIYFLLCFPTSGDKIFFNNSTFENNTAHYNDAINATEVTVVPPVWQKWLDNSQIAISVVGKFEELF